MNTDKRKQEKNQPSQDIKNDMQNNDQSPAKSDGFRYDYDDSSDVN
ncbi:hypothetical protein [Mesobacillus jeotgali]|nr:hypothetical protein [Mesobacillus jeotgali]